MSIPGPKETCFCPKLILYGLFALSHLHANHDKFQGMVMGKGNVETTHLKVHGSEIKCVNSMKLLGVTVDKQLNFKLHVGEIFVKAARQLNVLRRLSKYLHVSSKLAIYKSFISSTFEYCPVAWIFCGKTNSSKLDKLNKRAIRIVYNDQFSSHEKLLKDANALSLSMLRLKFMIIEVYKCINELNPEYMNQMFSVKNTKYNLRDASIAHQNIFQTVTFGYRSFSYYGSKLWNSLPLYLKRIDEFHAFKRELHIWLLDAQPSELEIF